MAYIGYVEMLYPPVRYNAVLILSQYTQTMNTMHPVVFIVLSQHYDNDV